MGQHGPSARPRMRKRAARLPGHVLGIAALLVASATSAGSPAQAGRQPQTSAPRPPRTTSATPPEKQAPRLNLAFGRLPLAFELNRGQTDPRVKFQARGQGYTLFLTSDEAVLALEPGHSKVEGRRSKPKNHGERVPNPQSRNPSILRMRLHGANPAPRIAGLDELPGKSNFFIGNNPAQWHTSIPTYARVKYEDIYPGVDLVYYGIPEGPGKLEYDFIVRPGADPTAITLDIEGAKRVRIDRRGNLVLQARGREVRFEKPRVYQPAEPGTLERRSIEGRFVLQGRRRVAFQVASYDTGRPLVIDPVLGYATYLGGSNSDEGLAVAVDASGNAYLTGKTLSTDFPTKNPLQATCASCTPVGGTFNDVFVSKLSPSASGAASLVYSTYLGGADDDEGRAIAVDSLGNAYVGGVTFSNNFPLAGAFQTIYAGSGDAFLAKLDATGSTLLYSTYYGGFCTDEVHALALDGSANVYLTGQTCSTNFPTSAGAFQTTGASLSASTPDAFVVKLNPAASGSASRIYATYLGGSDKDIGNGIAVDGAGNAVVVGETASSNFPFPTTGAFFDRTCGTDGKCDGGLFADAFVSKLNSTGSDLVYSTFLGGGGSDRAAAVALDGAGNVYVTGSTNSVDFPTTTSSFQPARASGFDAFVVKLIPDRTLPAIKQLVYSTYLGGDGFDSGLGIAVDSNQNAFVAGSTSSADFPKASPVQATCLGCPSPGDGFVTKLNAAGSAVIFSTFLGGAGSDVANGIALDSPNPLTLSVYIAGTTASPDFPVTKTNAFQSSCTGCGSGTPDAFLAKISGPLVLPVLSPSPKKVSFTDPGLGATTAPQAVTLVNNGDATLTISSIAASSNFTQTPAPTSGCSSPVTLAPGMSCAVNVTFSPTAMGTWTGTLTINDDAFGSPHTVSLSALSAAVVTLSPTSIPFGNQRVGTASAAQAITLTNTGSGALGIGSITTSLAVFTHNEPRCPVSPETLPAGSSCKINVTYTPTATGTSVGTLSIFDNAAGSPHTVSLSGTGVAPAVNLSAAGLTFGTQLVGTTSAPQTVTLTNSGTDVLAVSSITASGDFAQTNKCGTSLAVSASCEITVTFTPTTFDTRRGAVTITDDASGSPHTAALSGNGTDFLISASPNSATIFAGQTATSTLTIRPAGGFNLAVSLACSGQVQAATCSISSSTVTPDGFNPSTTTLNFVTTARSGVFPKPPGPRQWLPQVRSPWALWLATLVLLLVLAASERRRRLAFGLIVVCVLLAGACGGGGAAGGGGGGPTAGTPAGTFTLTVTATTGGLTHTTTITVTVV